MARGTQLLVFAGTSPLANAPWPTMYHDVRNASHQSGAPSATCNNGVREGAEPCDGDDLGALSCQALGYTSGLLSCTTACIPDVSNCAGGAATLIFSEYVEGSSNNKAVELYNASEQPVDLSACRVNRYINGATSPITANLAGGMLAPGDTWVVCHSSAGSGLAPLCDELNSTATNFNGNDALTLECSGVVLDSVGRVGEDPGSAWGTAPTQTVDATLRRLPGITRGDTLATDAFEPAQQWTGLPINTFNGLGSR